MYIVHLLVRGTGLMDVNEADDTIDKQVIRGWSLIGFFASSQGSLLLFISFVIGSVNLPIK